jgi:deoxyribodipyrimidine photo-lyase
MNRRVDSNHAVKFAAGLANELALPLLFYEGLTCSYPYAGDRLHRVILEGVPETQKRLAACGIGYVFYLRRRGSDLNDVLYHLAARAAAVVTDDYPTFVTARQNPSVAGKLDKPFYVVDSSCIVPMAHFEKREHAAYTIRPKIRKLLPHFLKPVAPVDLRKPFPARENEFHTRVAEANIDDLIASCDIDYTVPPSLSIRGGRLAAEKRLEHFLEHGLSRYAGERKEPAARATSGLSPYLHFRPDLIARRSRWRSNLMPANIS